MSADVAGLIPQLQPWSTYLSRAIGARITSTRRSYTEQARLWRLRQRVLSGQLPESAQPFPVARPGSSKHEWGLAWDMEASLPALAAAGRYWRSVGGTWSPSDPIHFEI